MDIKKPKIVIGIEIKQGFINIVCVETRQNIKKIAFLKALAIPSKILTEEEGLDLQILAEYISNSLMELDYEGAGLVIGISDWDFYKRVDLVSEQMTKEILKDKVAKEVAEIEKAKEEKYQIALQFGKEVRKNSKLAFYGAIQERLIRDFSDLAELLGLELLAVDIIPLAILRTIRWKDKDKKQIILTIVIEEDGIDMNVISDNQIFLTRAIRIDCADFAENEYLFSTIFQKFKMFTLAFSNMYPKEDFPRKIVLFSRMENRDKLLKLFNDKLSLEFECMVVKSLPNIKDKLNIKEKNIAYDLLEGSAAIGLALKIYDDAFCGLDFIEELRKEKKSKVKKKAFVISAVFLMIFGIAFAALFSFKGAILKLKMESNLRKDILTREKNAFGQDEQKMGLKKKLPALAFKRMSLKEQKQILRNIFSSKTNDLNINKVDADSKFNLVIKGSAVQRDSIYSFYTNLEKLYSKVKIAKIKTSFKKKQQVTDFEINLTPEKVKNNLVSMVKSGAYYFTKRDFNKFLMVDIGDLLKKSNLRLVYLKPLDSGQEIKLTGIRPRLVYLSLKGGFMEFVRFLSLLEEVDKFISLRNFSYSLIFSDNDNSAMIVFELDLFCVQ